MTITSAPPESRPVRRKGKAALTVTLWILLLPGLLWAIVRIGGWERGPLVQGFAFTPYVAAWAWLPVLLGLFTRRWTPALVALVAAVALAAIVLPRALPGNRGPAAGIHLQVMTSNMLFGGADPDTIVQLVRDHDVSVLAVQEFTAEGRKALADAGLGDLLPYSSLADEPQATGSGLYSRFPIADPGARRNGGGFMQAYATVQAPGAVPMIVESAHPLAPWAVHVIPDWRDDLAAEPKPDRNGPPRILLGDFNSTLDHTPLRQLIASGYRDAADSAGQGLVGTWGPYADKPLPPVTIDHVLVDDRIGVRGASVHRIPKSDHRAIIAQVTVPATS